MPQGAHEKPVPRRALKEVAVIDIVYSKPSQTSKKLVDSIHAICLTKFGKVLAPRNLKSGDICITADSCKI